MVTAYVMIVVKPGRERNVASKLLNLDYIQDISIVCGEYDLIIKVEVPDMRTLQNMLTNHLRKMKDVERTSTMIAVD